MKAAAEAAKIDAERAKTEAEIAEIRQRMEAAALQAEQILARLQAEAELARLTYEQEKTESLLSNRPLSMDSTENTSPLLTITTRSIWSM